MAMVGVSLGAITPVTALGQSLRSAEGVVGLMGDLFKGGRIEDEAAAVAKEEKEALDLSSQDQ
jgi:hypothetical protein